MKKRCPGCSKKLKPYVYKKRDGFPKLVGKSDGHTFYCKCMPNVRVSIG